MTRNVGATRGAKAKCDRLFSLIVRSRGACEHCGTTDYAQLQTAHIISRRYSHTRCLELNAFCLCARDHMYFTDYPVDFAAFVEQKIGDDYDALRALARRTSKVDWSEMAVRLTDRWNQIQEAIEA